MFTLQKDEYMERSLLNEWPHVDEYMDRSLLDEWPHVDELMQRSLDLLVQEESVESYVRHEYAHSTVQGVQHQG